MASLANPTVAWVCSRLGDSGDDGLPVSQLIEQFSIAFPELKDKDPPNAVWGVITGRDDISIGDDGVGIDWKKLQLKEVLLLEKIGRKVRVRAAGIAGPTLSSVKERAGSTIGIAPKSRSSKKQIRDASGQQNGNSIIVDVGTPIGADNTDEQGLPKTAVRDIQPKRSLRSQPTPPNDDRNHITQNGVNGNTAAATPPASTTSRAQTPQTFPTSIQSSPQNLDRDIGSPLKKTTITRYDKLQKKDDEAQRNAGVAKVYINPAGLARPRPKNARGRPRNSCIAVFKSSKLKDPKWLEDHQDSWVGVIASREEIIPASPRSIDDSLASAPPSKRARTSVSIPSTQLQVAGESTVPPRSVPLPQSPARLSKIESAMATDENGVTQPITQTQSVANRLAYQSPYASNSSPIPIPPLNYQASYRSPYAAMPVQSKSNHHIGGYKSIYSSPTQPSVDPRPAAPTIVPQTLYKSPYQTRSPPANTYTSPYKIQTTPPQPYVSPFRAPAKSSSKHVVDHASRTHVSLYGTKPIDTPSHTSSSIVNSGVPSEILAKSHNSPYRPLSTATNDIQTNKAQDAQSSISISQSPAEKTISQRVDLSAESNKPKTDPVTENVPVSTGEAPVTGRRKRGRPRRIRPELSPDEIKLRERIAAAENAVVPSCAAYLSSIWQDLVGNLVLSKDKSTLTFHAVEQADKDEPALTIDVKQMVKNPVTSVPGSNPMELLVFAKDENDSDVTHRFTFSSADFSCEAANNLRAKLVTSMIITDLNESEGEEDEDEEASPVQLEAEKPFVCEICGNRWKNKEGILYHKTRSNTTCNPNFNPDEYTREHPGGRRKRRKLEELAEIDDGLLDDGEDIVENVAPDDQALASIKDVEEPPTEPGVRRQPRRAAREAARRILKKKIVPAETKALKEIARPSDSNTRVTNQDGTYVSPYLPLQQGSGGLNTIIRDQSSDESYEEERPKRKRGSRAKYQRREPLLEAGDSVFLVEPSMTTPATPEKARRTKGSKSRLYTWATAPMLLQNPQTGAWNQWSSHSRVQVKRKIVLPEPDALIQLGISEGAVAYPSQQVVWQVSGVSSPSPSPKEANPAVAVKRPAGRSRVTKRSAILAGRQKKDKALAEFQTSVLSFIPRFEGPLNPGLDTLPSNFGLRQLTVGPVTSTSATDGQVMNASPISEKTEQSNEKALGHTSDLSWLLNNTSDSFTAEAIISKVEPDAVHTIKELQSSWGIFQLEVETIARWEQDEAYLFLELRSLAPHYRWINHTVDHPSGIAPSNIKWEDQNAFTVVTLPYEELDNIIAAAIPEEFDINFPGPRQRSSVTPIVSDRQAEPRKYQRFHTTRYQTAIASDFEGILTTPEVAAAEVGVELMPVGQHQPRKRTLDGTMPPEMEIRLIVAAVVLRTLTGGLDSQIDWVLLEMVLPQYSMHWLRKKWLQVAEKKKAMIENISSEFQEVFLEGYEAGEIPYLDYDHLIDYDWNWLVDWTLQRVDTSSEETKAKKSKAVSLPASRDDLEQQFKITETGNSSSNWRDIYFGLLPPVYKRMELSSSVPYTTPVKPYAQDDEVDDITLVKSWTRATCFTSDSSWDSRIAGAKLNSVPQPVVEKALESLLSSKVLMHKAKGRAVPGRPYDATDLFYTSLRKHITESMFVEAANYKFFLDQSFRSGNECVRFDYFANEGTVMCVVNLQAQGRVKLIGVNVPNDKFGLTDGGYETRKLDKSKYRFDMDIYPTDSYMFDSDNPALKKLAEYPCPGAGKRGELPLWLDIQEKMIDSLWKKTIAGVFGIISLRAGIDVAGLTRVFSPALESWEIRRLMEWGVEIGALKRPVQNIDGWTTGEWWWLVAGKICSV
ncbi:hypothetical protein F5884DRAFT_800375 [Xylogone sp. PMI_703]|nr:hypothetical protein F5884DRAFT_800375 [Xylogone sp. PMI_703]